MFQKNTNFKTGEKEVPKFRTKGIYQSYRQKNGTRGPKINLDGSTNPNNYPGLSQVVIETAMFDLRKHNVAC